MQLPKAIILGSYVNALAVTRSLGRKGIYVAMVSYDRHQIGSYSRYVKEFQAIPDPLEEENGLYNLLMSKAPKWKGAIVIPTDDFYVDILSKKKAELSKNYVVAAADRPAIQIIQNKRSSYDLALRLNIPAPKSLFPENLENVSELAKNVVYPCILKAYEGHKFKRHYPIKVIVVNSPAKLYSEYAAIFRQHPLMIQEIIEGDDSNIMQSAAYYDLEGQPLAEYTGRKIRQYPPSYGNARVAESILNPEILLLSRPLLKVLDYRGSLVNVEFKYDNRDGQLKFIEINARSTMWYSLVEASGMNLPWIMYQDLVLGKKVRQSSHKDNIFWIHETVDIFMLFHRDMKRVTLSSIYPHISQKKPLLFLPETT